ncbi:hypothetical protein JCM10296v2_003445 [Rhodotorula toruloides]
MLSRTVAAGSGSRKAFELFIVPPSPHQSAGTSSTTQAHATATDGPDGEGGMAKCCVCGQATDKRCQACAKSGIDLFFCSPEHQKLVWKHHKHDMANVDAAIRVAEPDEVQRLTTLVKQPPRTVRKGIEEDFGAPSGSFSLLVQQLRSPSAFPPDQQDLLLIARETLKSAKIERKSHSFLRFHELDFWSHVAALDFVLPPRREPSNEELEKSISWSHCRHQAVVVFSLLTSRRAAKNSATVPLDLIHRAIEQYFDLIGRAVPALDEPRAGYAAHTVLAAMWDVDDFKLYIDRDSSGHVVVRFSPPPSWPFSA